MKKIYLILLISFSLLSCYKRTDKPENLLSKKEMMAILFDLHLMEEIKLKNPSATEIKLEELDKAVFLKYNISEVDFRTSHSYWHSYPLEYKEIYGLLKDSLTDFKAFTKRKINKDIILKKKRKDSLDSIHKVKYPKNSIKEAKIIRNFKDIVEKDLKLETPPKEK